MDTLKDLIANADWRSSLLGTDAYKFSMLAGGRPNETEVFYLSYRKGGRLYMPVDLHAVVEDLLPRASISKHTEDAAYLNEKGFKVTEEMLEPLMVGDYEIVYAVPKGEWCDPREPIITIRGPQAIVSWLEPLLIGRIMYQMQVATAYLAVGERIYDDPARWYSFLDTIERVTCEEQKRLTIEAIKGAGWDKELDIGSVITVDEQGYYDAVKAQCQKLLDTGVEPNRFFEVGLRAATCMEQHLIALKACKDMGFNLTSNVYGAWLLDMVPVGTLGHEGIMRWGGDDELAYRKHMDAMPKVIFLLDTNDTLKVGLPTAFKLFSEHPDRMDGVRPDSGDLEEQFRAYVDGQAELNTKRRPWIFEDGLDEDTVAKYEALRAELCYPKELTLYGLGGYFVDRPEFTPYKRGAISMIYKLTWTEKYGPAMKFANEIEEGDSGKQSIPGTPVTLVRHSDAVDGPKIMVGQEGHEPHGYSHFTVGDSKYRPETVPSRPEVCPHTQLYVQASTQARVTAIKKAEETD